MAKSNKMMIVGACLAVITIIGAGFYYLNNKEQEPIIKEPVDQNIIVSHVIGYSNDGLVALYDTQEGKELSHFDLKTLSEKKVIQVEEIIEPMEDNNPTLTETSNTTQPEVETYKDFEMVEVVIKKGDYAWKIQKELTPKRDIGQMIKFVSDVNGGKVLHPIFAGEKLYFLKEKEVKSDLDLKVEIPVQEKVSQKPPETVIKTKSIDDAKYLFFADTDNRVIYAYSDFADEIYKITEIEGKLDVQKIAHNEKLSQATKMIVSNEKVYLSLEVDDKLQILDLKNSSIVSEIQLSGIASNIVIKDDVLYYTYNDQIGRYDLITNEQYSVLVGDESLDLVSHQDKLYVLNAFGNKTENSLLMQINPSDLNVDNILELKSNVTAILSKGSEEFLLVGVTETSKDLSGNEIIGHKISEVKLNTLSLENSKWTIPFTEKSMLFDSFLYVLNDQTLNAYTISNVVPTKSIEIIGDGFVILP